MYHGWVERSETHRGAVREMMGIAEVVIGGAPPDPLAPPILRAREVLHRSLARPLRKSFTA